MLIEISGPYLFLNSVVALNRIILVSSYTIKEGILYLHSDYSLISHVLCFIFYLFLTLIENISTTEFELGIKAQLANSMPVDPPEKKSLTYSTFLLHSKTGESKNNFINIEINSQPTSDQNSIVR